MGLELILDFLVKRKFGYLLELCRGKVAPDGYHKALQEQGSKAKWEIEGDYTENPVSGYDDEVSESVVV